MQKTVSLVAAESFSWPVAAEETVETDIVLDAPLTAPLAAGTAVGQAVFAMDGTEIGRVELLCAQAVAPRVDSALATLKLAG